MNAIQIVTATILVIALSFNYYQSEKVESLQEKVQLLMLDNRSKQATIEEQGKEIRDMPARYIETTRAMDKEICLGINQIDKVMSMTSSRNIETSFEVSKEDKNEKVITVDIDDRLPPDLVKLLNED